MIERRNIIKLLSERTNVYHSAILTCYSFDPIFFESLFLPSLRTIGVVNVVVLMEASLYDNLLEDPLYKCHKVLTRNYTLVRQENIHNGVFHPKMTLLFGEEEGVLMVGSGNLTFSGILNNEEVWNVFHLRGSNSVHYPLLHKAWGYINELTTNVSSLIHKQLDWMIEQSTWIRENSDDKPVVLSSGEVCSLLFNSSETTILYALTTAIRDTKIKTITIVAPFYDSEGSALKELKNRFSPNTIHCVLDLERQSAPYDLLKQKSNINFFKYTSTNPLHAKIIEIQGEGETWLLSGSANAGNMALGVNASVYNDEVCILLHSKKKREYIKELGIKYVALKSEEKKSIKCPEKEEMKLTSKIVTLSSCEEKDNALHLRFNKEGIKGRLVLLDDNQTIVFYTDITTKKEVKVDLKEKNLSQLHIAVLKENDIEISNRILIIKELDVESCNPDPKRRKLSNLLDDVGLLENLSHIFGYIEFDDPQTKIATFKGNKSSAEKKNEEVIVARNRFDVLKESEYNISMHSGVRILAYFQQMLFKMEENEQTDDELLSIDEEKLDVKSDANDEKATIEKGIDEANRIRDDIINYLKRMKQFLEKKAANKDYHGETNPAVGKPKLNAASSLNSASSLAVAVISVVFMMNKYGSKVIKKGYVKELLIECAGRFFALYTNMYPEEDDNRSRKIRELLKEASVDLFTALSFFEQSSKDYHFQQLILNCLCSWHGKPEIKAIMPLFEERLKKMNINNLNARTIDRILYIGKTYLNEEVPIRDFSSFCNKVYFFRDGYGFLVLDDIRRSTKEGWSYTIHSPWFEVKINKSSSTKYKGYRDL